MSVLSRNRRLNRLAVVLVAGLSLAAITLPTTSAQARVFVGVGIPFPGAYYAPPAYAYPYGYPYYGYPAYGYPGGVFIGGTFGPHRHHHHW